MALEADVDRSPVGVLQLVDTLEAGGMERMGVSLANGLPRSRFRSYLCTSRKDGPLGDLLAPDVGRLALARRHRFDAGAVRRLVRFVGNERIRVIHAHGPSLFLAAAAAGFLPRTRVVWHVHAGTFAEQDRRGWVYRPIAGRAAAVIAVSAGLEEWVRRRLHVPRERVWHIANFTEDSTAASPGARPAGDPVTRIVCVANLRPEKDHETLLGALARVPRSFPVQLALVGNAPDPDYRSRLEERSREAGLSDRVTWLGPRSDVAAILAQSDVGVLSSRVEGLPLALIEYGMAGLAVVATDVGACGEVLEGGRVGLLVAPGDPEALADALLKLIESPSERERLGHAFRSSVRRRYGKEAAIRRIGEVYDRVLGASAA